jgi:hypothetical protein
MAYLKRCDIYTNSVTPESSVPQIISSGSNIYVVWQDDTPENLTYSSRRVLIENNK